MTQAGIQRVLMVLLILASVGTTALVILAVLKRQGGRVAEPVLLGGMESAPGPTPPVLATLPSFQLVDQQDRPVTLDHLRDKVWVVAFVFTRCQGPCPMMVSRMAELQMAWQSQPQWDRLRLVSISVDPGHDTPAVLAERARISHADPQHWLWLTGNRETIWRLCGEGFKLPVGEDAGNPAMPIFHSQKFVLVDGLGRVRGYYDGLEASGRADLERDLRRVLDEN